VPPTADHLARVRHNIECARSFDWDTTPYLDALLFYKDGAHGDLHTTRRRYIREKSYLRGIEREFENLKDLSEDARYRLLTMTRVKLESKVIPLYKAIEQHVIQQLPKQHM
jgi:hypothetical protein